MLFFTFCKVNPPDLRLRRWHLAVLAVQTCLAVGSYYALVCLAPYGSRYLQNPLVAQSVMLCFLMPTATAAPIIAGKLGGSIQNLTTFILLDNFSTAVVVPFFFPLVHPLEGMTFAMAVWLIVRKVGPLLVLPFMSAWLLRVAWDRYPRHKREGKTFSLSPQVAQIPFFLWVCTIVILMAQVVYSFVCQPVDGVVLVYICIGAVAGCLLQFFLGRQIGFLLPAGSHGKDYQDVPVNPAAVPTTKRGISRLTAGQAFGQKNTTLAIWMAQTYLLPLSAVGPAVYMIVQNVFISFQLRQAAGCKRE